MESCKMKYAFDARSEAFFKEVDKLLDVVGPSVLNDSNQAPLILLRAILPMIHTRQYWQLL